MFMFAHPPERFHVFYSPPLSHSHARQHPSFLNVVWSRSHPRPFALIGPDRNRHHASGYRGVALFPRRSHGLLGKKYITSATAIDNSRKSGQRYVIIQKVLSKSTSSNPEAAPSPSSVQPLATLPSGLTRCGTCPQTRPATTTRPCLQLPKGCLAGDTWLNCPSAAFAWTPI